MVLKISNPVTSISVVPKKEHDVTRINSIQFRYKEERYESKAPTFALT